VTGNDGDAWLPVRRTAEPDGTPEPKVTGVTVRSLDVEGTLGVFGMNATGATFESDAFIACDEALTLDGDSRGSTFSDLVVQSGGRGRWGLAAVQGDDSVYSDLTMSYAISQLVLYGGTGQQLFHALLAPSLATSVYGAYVLHAGATFEGLYFDNEGTMPLGQGDVVVVGSPSPFTLFKGEIDVGSGSAMIPVTIDGGHGFVIEGASFGDTAGSPELVHVSATTTGVQEMIGVTADSSAPLSDDGALVSIGN
jgi:hypothetical protein